MSTNNFFRAKHRESGEVIEFGLGDIGATIRFTYDEEQGDYEDKASLFIFNTRPTVYLSDDWLKDYTVEYQHNGEWFEYKETI